MGRVTGTLAYRVKNTFVEIGPSDQERGRAHDDVKGVSGASPHLKAGKGGNYVPDTPSPFLHPASAPQDGQNMPLMGLGGDGSAFGGDLLPPAFADMGEGFMGMPPSFDGQDMPGFFGLPAMMYDPNTGAYSTCGWCMPMEALGQTGPGGAEGEGMAGHSDMPMEALMEGQGFEGMPMDPENPDGAQGWDGMGENGWGGEGMENGGDMMDQGWAPDGMQMDGMGEYPEGQGWNGDGSMMQHMDAIQETSGWGHEGGYNGEGCMDENGHWNGDMEGGRVGKDGRGGEQGWNDDGRWGRGKGGRGNRRQERQQERQDVQASSGNGGEASPAGGTQQQGADGQNQPVGFTTVMLRNIPNKYTREMLVKQLSVDFRGRFDFVYLPIDFKNRCNVGYGFINFRTTEACEEFVNRFNGVDVRKCLPGLNSRKVAEVTPARVQGLDENVRRLRNGPVMNELVHHPEWMPLLLDEEGEEKPFPLPDQPCPPVKPRRRAGGRDEHGGGRGGW